jgi:hypothetical protein
VNKNPKILFRRAARIRQLLGLVILPMLLVGCTFTLVQPYDQKLFDDTEAFYKKAASMILDGEMASPLRDADRGRIAEPITLAQKHAGESSA